MMGEDPMERTEAVAGKWDRPIWRSASAAEYLIIMLLICLGVGFGALTLSKGIAASMNDAGACIASQGVQCE
jgi:hypothetical protein